MKNKLILTLLTVFLGHWAYGQKDTIQQHEIVVDGNVSDWDAIETYSSTANKSPDYAIDYKLSWDNENLYVLFEVEDDTAAVFGKGIYVDQKAWHVDLIYLHLDVDNSKNDDFDGENDFALRIHRDTLLEIGSSDWPVWYGKIPGLDNSPGYISDVWGTSYQTGFIGMGLSIIQNETDKGYTIELAVPFTFLTKADDNLSPSVLSNGSELGLRIELHDMDALDDQSGLSIPSGSEWGNPSTWGTVVLEGEDTPATDIVIDGEIDVLWEEIPAFDINSIVQPTNPSHNPHEVEDEADLSGSIKIRWDELGLYFLVQVLDDSIVSSGAVSNSDYVEIGIDPENIKDLADPGFISFTISPGDTSLGGRIAPGWSNIPDFDYAVLRTNDGYNIECLLPVDVMRNPNMELGTYIGFDAKINDVDDPVSPKWDHLGWNMEDGYIWRDPFRYGTIELIADAKVTAYKSPAEPQNLQATVNGYEVEFTWDKVVDASGYYLIKQISNEEGIVYADTINDGNITSTVIDGFTPGIYEYNIVSFVTGDARSAPKQSVTFVVEEITSFNHNKTDINISCFPNPVTDILYIKGVTNGSLSIIDLSGKRVLHRTTIQNSLSIASLGSGIYILEIKSENNIFRSKICVNR